MDFLGLVYWERFPDTNRDVWGVTALALCRALQTVEGVSFAYYYWADANTIVIMIAADSVEARDRAMGRPSSRVASAYYDLSDLSRVTRTERLSTAKQANLNYRAAGR